MKYVQPFDQPSNPTAAYVDLNAATGTDGSIPPAKFFNDVQAEILNVITNAGLTPNSADMTQLREAILSMIPTPTGAPSDASLVHFALDAGEANALAATPTPAVSSVSTGLTILCVAAANNTGAATIAVTPAAGGPIVKNIRRGDNSALQAGDIRAGRLLALVYDGTAFRIAWPNYGVTADGLTIGGDGTAANPLRSIIPTGQLAAAWVVFSVAGGVPTILAAYNVASVTRYVAAGGPGYTANFLTPMTSSNYAAMAACSGSGGQAATAAQDWLTPTPPTPTGFSFIFGNSIVGRIDPTWVSMIFFRN